MKINKLLNIVIAACLVLVLVGCDDTDSPEFNIPETTLEILTPLSGTQIDLISDNENNTALTLVWEDAEEATGATYTVEMALSATDFEFPAVAATTSEKTVSWTVLELNTFLTESLGLAFNAQQAVDLRILSDQGFMSSLITLAVTPYGLDPLPRMAVPGNHQGWNPSEAEVDFVPYIAATLEGDNVTNFEGYMWLDGEFKFVEPNASGEFVWGNVDWEDDGTFSGIMTTDGPGNFPGQPAGFYYVNGNTETATYNIESVSWGIIGAATPTGWGSDTDLIYNAETRVIEVDIDLTEGQPFKFRGNNDWGNYHDLGTIDEDGFLQQGGDIIFSQPTGNYHVEIDMKDPRRYILTITPNS